jgi:hypothetical protein
MIIMTGFDFYNYLIKDKKGIEQRLLSDGELAELISNTKRTIRANCGELKRFSNPKALEALASFLEKGGTFETTFGRLVFGAKSGLNPAIEMFAKNGYLGVSAKCYYTLAEPVEQVFAGNTHVIIFDDGETIFVEKPHGYNSEDGQVGVVLHSEYKLAEAFGNFMNGLYSFREITDNMDSELIANTVKQGASLEIGDSFSTNEEFLKYVFA